ncbi:MAG: outer membrane beta-barrel family protein [Taibaiella sp.]|nr:outer membrane beta-barrel family protein [Taibaiella sp.]
MKKSNADVRERYHLLQSDLIYPILNDGKFETGIRSQWRNMNNQFGFFRTIRDRLDFAFQVQ